MAGNTQSILCGKCKVALEGPADPGPNDTVRCPRCGVTEKFQRVMRELDEFVADYASDYLTRGLRSSKYLKIDTKPVQKRRHRFIIDM